jgi:hypothetical protein
MCLGCLFVFFAASFPRVGLIVTWIFTSWIDIAFNSWVWPVLGFIFLPFATLVYVLCDIAYVGDIGVGGWILVAGAAILDLSHWAQVAYNRQNGVAMYNEYGPSRFRG